MPHLVTSGFSSQKARAQRRRGESQILLQDSGFKTKARTLKNLQCVRGQTWASSIGNATVKALHVPPLPVQEANLYIRATRKHYRHWSDKSCLQILQTSIPASRHFSRNIISRPCFICDTVFPSNEALICLV